MIKIHILRNPAWKAQISLVKEPEIFIILTKADMWNFTMLLLFTALIFSTFKLIRFGVP